MMKGRIPPPPPPPGSAKPQSGSPDSVKPEAAATAARPPLPPPPPGPLLRSPAVQAEFSELSSLPVSAGRRRSVWLLGGALAAVVLAALCWVGYYAASARSFPELDDALETSRHASDPGRRATTELRIPEVSAVAINPGMEKGQIRAVLTWGKEAKDLDAHLEGPLPDAKRFHVYYHEQGDLKSKEFVRLDVDDQDGGGPETVTVLCVLPGVYRYFVHDYTNRDHPAAHDIARAQAEVRLYQGGQTYRFRAGHATAGNLWDVCTIEVTPQGAVVKKVDQYQGVKASALNLYAKRTKGSREQWIGSYGGSAISEKAVTDGLDWLVRHQAADGSWSNKNLGPGAETLCNRAEPCFGTGEACEMAHSGLALLALQAGGHYYFNRQTHSDEVRKGLDWMVSHQRPDGGLVGSLSQGNNFHQTYMYEHGIAAFALADACAAAAALGEPRHERYYNAMEKAVEFIYRHQHNDGGWRYTPHPNAASDTSVTGWPVLALKSAKEAGVPLRDDMVEKVRAYFRAREAGRDGRTGYDSPHSYHTHATTGVGMLARQFLLKEPDAPLIRDAADYLAKAAETTWKDRSPAGQNRDYYMWYNCTLGMFQAGGENWKRWNSVVRDTIVNLQRHGGCPSGSWDPSDRWGGRGGRIYSTALAILTLEVYYRYTAPSELKPDEFELHSTGKEQGEK